MSLRVVRHRQPYDYYQINDYEDFLLNYRYTLVNVIDVEEAIPWLMQNDILDKHDQELIMNGHKTSVLKAGDLIDTITRRGPNGFNILMEFIEYEYPAIFKKVTNMSPRKPDPRVYVPSFKRSVHLSMRSKVAMQQIFKALEDSKIARTQADRSMKELQEKIEDAENDLEMKHQQILEMSQKILELQTHNRDLMEQVQQAQKEAAEAVKQQDIFRQERDKYRHDCQTQKENLLKTFLVCKKKPHGAILRPEKDESVSSSESAQIKELKDILSKLKKENKELEENNTCLDEQLNNILEQCDLLESSNLDYKDQVESLKAERDQVLHQFTDLKQKYVKLQEENNTLKENLLDQQSHLRILKNENDISRPRITHIAVKRRPDEKKPDLVENLKTLTENFHSYCDSDGENSNSAESIPSSQPGSSSSGEERQDAKQNGWRWGIRGDDKAPFTVHGSDLNMRSCFKMIRNHPAGKNHVLVVYAPCPLHSKLYKHLYSEYSWLFPSCPREMICDDRLKLLPKWLEAGQCIHYKKHGEGSYDCLGTNTLNYILHSGIYGQVLLDLPVEAIPRMTTQNIHTYVIVLKYSDLEMQGEKSKEEIEVEKIQDACSCIEKLIVRRNSSIELISQLIVSKFVV